MESARYESIIDIMTLLAVPELGRSLLTLLPTAQPWTVWYTARDSSFRAQSLSMPAVPVDFRLSYSFTIRLLEPELVYRIRGHQSARTYTAPQPSRLACDTLYIYRLSLSTLFTSESLLRYSVLHVVYCA